MPCGCGLGGISPVQATITARLTNKAQVPGPPPGPWYVWRKEIYANGYMIVEGMVQARSLEEAERIVQKDLERIAKSKRRFERHIY